MKQRSTSHRGTILFLFFLALCLLVWVVRSGTAAHQSHRWTTEPTCVALEEEGSLFDVVYNVFKELTEPSVEIKTHVPLTTLDDRSREGIHNCLSRLQALGIRPLPLSALPLHRGGAPREFSGIPTLATEADFHQYLDYCTLRNFDIARYFYTGSYRNTLWTERGSYYLVDARAPRGSSVQEQSSALFYTDFYHMLRAVNDSQDEWMQLTQEELQALRTALSWVEDAMTLLRKDGAPDTIGNRARYLQKILVSRVKYHDLADKESVFYKNRNKFVIYAMQGNAICEGYAQAYGFLLALAGIKSVSVSGHVIPPNKGAHAWNMVCLGSDDAWYHVDATWNDSGSTDSNKYFMVTDEEMGPKGFNRTWGEHQPPLPRSATRPYNHQTAQPQH